MTKLHTLALRVTELNIFLGRVKLGPAVELPALREVVLTNMPDAICPMTEASLLVQMGKTLRRSRFGL